jgi:hypothetical protein
MYATFALRLPEGIYTTTNSIQEVRQHKQNEWQCIAVYNGSDGETCTTVAKCKSDMESCER